MMGRSRRGVKFPPHKGPNGLTSGSDGRRASFSDVSEEGSPTKTKSGVQLDGIQEVHARLAVRAGGETRDANASEQDWELTDAGAQTPTAEEKLAAYEKKKANFITRTFWTFVMFGGFFTALFMGHIYIIAIVTAIQIVSFKEVIAISNVPSRARQLRLTKSLNWYWLATTMYFLYGESVIYYFKHIVLVDKVLLPLATHHRFISFVLYVIGEWEQMEGNIPTLDGG